MNSETNLTAKRNSHGSKIFDLFALSFRRQTKRKLYEICPANSKIGVCDERMNIKQTFTAADGATFDTIEAAEKHNLFVEARKKFDDAWRDLSRIANDQFKTADGFDFVSEYGSFFEERCYLVRGDYSLNPTIMEISLYPSSVRSIAVDDKQIRIRFDFYNGREHSEIQFDLCDLFKKKENAQKRIVEILKSNIEICEKQIAEIENHSG